MRAELRNISARKFERALRKDGFQLVNIHASHRTYAKGDRVLTLSYHHSSDTFRRKTLMSMLRQTGWTEEDLRRLGLIH